MAHVQLYYHPDDSNQALEAITKIGSTLNSAQIMTLCYQFICHKLGAEGYEMMTKVQLGLTHISSATFDNDE